MTESEHSPGSTGPRFAGAADIHSHPLPAIDDGAVSLEASLMMLRIAARYGTSRLVATPHRYWNAHENTPDLLRRLTQQTQQALEETKFGQKIELIVGQEVPLTLQTADELQRGDVLTLGDMGRYVLVEPPFDHLPDWTADALSAIVAAGFHPVLAHPERNAVVQRDPESAVPLKATGAAFQLTAMSVTGANGAKALAASHWLLDNGLATVLASDSHSPTWRPPTMRGGYHALVARYGIPFARRLCIENPQAIATGKPLLT